MGAFVISLDVEFLWGVRAHYPPDGGAYRADLLRGRAAIPKMLDRLAEFGIAAARGITLRLIVSSRNQRNDNLADLLRSTSITTFCKWNAENQFPLATVEETGQQVPATRPDVAMAIGSLKDGGVFSVHIEGGQRHRMGLQINIVGTKGVLSIANPRTFENSEDHLVAGVNGDGVALSPLTVPAASRSLASTHLDASVQDVAYLYAAYARDRKHGTSDASNFRDPLRQHRLIDQIVQASGTVFHPGSR